MDENTNVNVGDNDQNQDNEGRTYSFEEVQALIQSESDKRVTEALKKRDKKNKASLDELNRQRAEVAGKDDRIAELEKRLNDYERLQQRSEIASVLADRKMDARLIDCLNITNDAEDNIAIIEKLDTVIKETVDEQVKARLAATGGSIKDGAKAEAMTQEDFDKLTLAQQAELFKTRPELYRKFTTN